jgi:DNA-binding HxlR family transcriptional regulator
VEYELTELGRTLRKPIQALAKWAQENREEIQLARNRYDTDRKSPIPAFAKARLPRR